MPVETLVATTVAFAITAPDASFTVPAKSPLVIWPNASPVDRRQIERKRKGRKLTRIKKTSLLIEICLEGRTHTEPGCSHGSDGNGLKQCLRFGQNESGNFLRSCLAVRVRGCRRVRRASRIDDELPREGRHKASPPCMLHGRDTLQNLDRAAA